ACGHAGPSSPPRPSAHAAAGPPSRKLVATLTGHTAHFGGAPHGAGVAVIALHDTAQEICWRFAHLHGFTNATHAEIHRGDGRGTNPVAVALSNGSRLHHKGCTPARPALIALIARQPDRFYVTIDTARFPAGAVRGPL
ncbi:MAG: CHRD domain-containing protein, partial [Actinomycetota bacterium]|nr:CHRD domain-containing protein [Actinomycetota bacterium]